MTLLDNFLQYAREQDLLHPHDRLLLAVSGGVDSVVLTSLCARAGFDCIIAHCNFKLRGPESDRDEDFVRSLGAKYKLPVAVKTFDTKKYASDHKLSIQVAARQLRYDWFEELAGIDAGAKRKIVTAHHQDDNVETLLMNFFKGTGIAGLRAMLPQNGNITRPLLFASKQTLRDFAVANSLEWIEDSSNTEDKYARNFFRNRIIPAVSELYPAAINNLAGNIPRFRDIEILYHQSIEGYRKNLLAHRGAEIHIPVLKLLQCAPLSTIVYELTKDYGFSPAQSTEIISLLNSQSGKFICSSTHRLLKNRNWLIISPLQNSSGSITIIAGSPATVAIEPGELEFKKIPAAKAVLPSPAQIALLDAGLIQFPLLVRPWKTGDYFYPLGMRKKKKLARFFIDQKLSKSDKEKIWVVEMDKKIIWVIGHRIDDRFKIASTTREALQIEMRMT